jgi:hypothetical protein
MNETLNNMSRNPIGGVLVTVLRMVGVALGLALMVLSLPLAITPIPLGIPLFILGVLLLAGSSPTAHRIVTGYLKRHPGIWRRVKRMFGEKDEPADSDSENRT